MKIKEPAWSKLACDTKISWIWESNNNKEIINVQFVTNSKSTVPVTKNRSLAVYFTEFDDNDGYNSDFTANLEGIFKFNVNSAILIATTYDNSNGEILEGSDLNVNVAAAATKSRPSIL